MKTLLVNIKSEADAALIRKLLVRLNVNVEDAASLKSNLDKSKFKSEKDFLSYAGSMKGQLKSKEHLRSIAWKNGVDAL